MKLKNNFFFLLLICITIFTLEPIHVERAVSEADARKELKKATEEGKSKLEEIRKQQQEIQEKEKRDEIGQEEATKDLVELNKEARELLEKKIQAANDVLNFQPTDAAAQKARKTAQATQKELETELKRLETRLKETGVAVEAPVQTDMQLSLGTRIAKNFKIWRDTARAKVHESLGDYKTARKLRDNLATLYKELRKPTGHVENLLAVDRLSLKLGETPHKLSNLINDLTNHLQRLDAINVQEQADLNKATTPEQKERIRSQDQDMRTRSLDPKVLDDILETTIKIREKISDPVVVAVESKLELLENQLETIFSQLDASKNLFRPRTVQERKADIEQSGPFVKDLVLQVKNTAVDKGASLTSDPLKVERSKEYDALMKNLEKLEAIDFEMLAPERKLEVASTLKSTYEKLSDQYGSLLKDRQVNKKFTPEEQASFVGKWRDFTIKSAQWSEGIESAIKEGKALENENSPEYKRYYSLVSENSKANVVDASRLNAAEIEIGKRKQEINELMQQITTDKNAPEKIDVAEINLDRAVEDILSEIAKSDPSQRSLETLKRILNSSTDSIEEFKSILETTQLPPEAQIALIKNYLKTIIRTEQVVAQRAEDLGALTVVVGKTLEILPQIARENIAKAHEIPLPPPSLTIVEVAKDIRQAGNAVAKEGASSLKDEIAKVRLKPTGPQTQATRGNEMVNALQEALNRKFAGALGEPGEEGEGGREEEWEQGQDWEPGW